MASASCSTKGRNDQLACPYNFPCRPDQLGLASSPSRACCVVAVGVSVALAAAAARRRYIPIVPHAWSTGVTGPDFELRPFSTTNSSCSPFSLGSFCLMLCF